MKVLSAKTTIRRGRRLTTVRIKENGCIKLAYYIGKIPNFLKEAA